MSSATDKQHRLLNELRKLACDINEKEIRSHSVITLNQGRYNRQFRLDMNHEWLGAWHAEFERILQAIEATLGPDVRHPKPHEQWTTVLLPEIAWDRGDRWPDYLSVAHDAHDEWRVYVPEATLGPRTCHPVPIYGFDGEFTEYDCDACSECGDEWEGDTPNFCPNCGARVVDPTTNNVGAEVSE